MKRILGTVAVGWAVMAGGRGAESVPPRLPAEQFARTDEVAGVALSPDGRTLAYQVGQDREWVLLLRDWETGRTTRVPSGAAATLPRWLNAERVLFGMGASVDRDGRNLEVNGPRPDAVIFHRFEGGDNDHVLALGHNVPVMGRYQSLFLIRHTHVERVNTRHGRFVRETENPGQVVQWWTDGKGAVRAGLADDGTRIRVVRRSGNAAEWQTPAGLDHLWDRMRPVGLGGDGKTLYVTVPTEAKRWALHTYDLETDRLGELLLGHDYYDINPVLVMAPRDRALLGARWWADKERTFWFHPELAAVQQALDKALPGTTNTILSLSDDLQRMVVLAWSARNPGVYFQFDRAKVELKPLFAVRPWVQAPQMAESFAASFKARDGLVIHGYLTVPTGREAKGMPVVVWLGNSAWSRATWGHDTTVQFLANRGYAVLQINPRGSSGYGQRLHEAGRRRIGSEIPADVVDGAKWAVAQGIADPRRLAIGGIDQGGGTALLATVREPELFRAAVAIDAVTDWPAQLAHLAQLDPVAVPRVRLLHGDPTADAAELAAASAIHHVERISAPVLLVNGAVETVPRTAARAFAAAMKRAGRPHEVFARFDAVEGLGTPRGYAEMLERLDEFLAKHLGVGDGAR